MIAFLGALCACLGLYLTYIYAGAEDLRTKVYEPLFAEVSKLGSVAEADSLQPFEASALENLTRTGGLERIPESLRLRTTDLYQEFAGLRSDLYPVAELIQRSVSRQVMMIRSKMQDKAWAISTSKKLRADSESKPGVSAITTFQFSHPGRGRAIDAHDPNHPIIAGPGGPDWTLSDWATFPDSVKRMETIWTEDDFLYFDPIRDDWYYRITRADLRTHGIDLESFLAPVYQDLVASPNYKHAIEKRPKITALAKSIAAEFNQRIRQPKHFLDLFR